MINFSSAKSDAPPKAQHEELWRAFWDEGGERIDALINAYLPLTHRVLERISIRLPSHIPVEDLSQAALLGLYKAILDFDLQRAVPFEAYAYPRIRGAVLDELRSNDYLSRSKRSQVDKMEIVISNWMKEHSEMPSEADIAKALNMSIEEFSQLMDQAKPWCSLDAGTAEERSLQETIADPNVDSEASAHRSDVQALLRAGFRKLDMREQKILYLYYFEELRLSEIAQLFNLSEARISQIHALSVVRLRAALSDDFLDEFAA
jgi:RNA polymerase sigma factor for flagellar operon FliA